MCADLLAERHPGVRVDPGVLYVDGGQVLTSAGTGAAIDLCLHVVRTDHGSEVANSVARRMVMPPHRDGGQAQYLDAPIATREAETLEPLLAWMVEHLAQDLDVATLAQRAHLSARTFARRFRAETGATPAAPAGRSASARAQRLLEQGDEPVERVAVLCGFGSAPVLRHHFLRRRGTTPQAYRRAFRSRLGTRPEPGPVEPAQDVGAVSSRR